MCKARLSTIRLYQNQTISPRTTKATSSCSLIRSRCPLTWLFFKPLFCVLTSLHWSHWLEFSLHHLVKLFVQFQSSLEHRAQNKPRTVTSWSSSARAEYMTIAFGHLISTAGSIFFHYLIITSITIYNKHLHFCFVGIFCFVLFWFDFKRESFSSVQLLLFHLGALLSISFWRQLSTILKQQGFGPHCSFWKAVLAAVILVTQFSIQINWIETPWPTPVWNLCV